MKLGLDLFPIQEADTQERGIGRYSRMLVHALAAANPRPDLLLYAVADLPCWGLPRCGAPVLTTLKRFDPATYRSWSLDAYLDVRGGNPDNLDWLLSTTPMRSLVLRRPGRPLRAAIHYDCIPEVYPDYHIPDPKRKHYYHWTMRTLATYDHVFTLSEHARDDLLDRHPAFFSDQVTVIGSGVDPCFRPAETAEERREDAGLLDQLGVRVSGYVLNVGGLDPRKGSLRLIEAMKLLGDKAPRLVLAFHADAIKRGNLLRHSASIGLPSESVLCTGCISDRAMVALLRNAAVMCFPSLYEGFGLPIVEAMACGTPVVAGGNTSQLEAGGRAAVFVNAANPEEIAKGLRTVLDDPGRADAMRQIGLAQARRFNWEAVTEKMLSVLHLSLTAASPV